MGLLQRLVQWGSPTYMRVSYLYENSLSKLQYFLERGCKVRYHLAITANLENMYQRMKDHMKKTLKAGDEVWYDNGQRADHRNLEGMRQGVRDSECLLIFLSG